MASTAVRVLAGYTPIRANWEGSLPLTERSRTKPVSFEELSCHVRLIRVEDAGVAVKPVGAAGKVLVPPPPPPPRAMDTLSKSARQIIPSLSLVTAKPTRK